MNEIGEYLVCMQDVMTRFEHLRFESPINWTIKKGEHWAVIGPNGGGKSLLIDILLGKHALRTGRVECSKGKISEQIKNVSFRDIYSLTDTKDSYYQQRWNAGLAEDAAPVRGLFADANQDWLNSLVTAFGIEDLMDKTITLLSSGELRKVLIVRSLLSKPSVLILDNPFIGLDADSRVMLNELLERFSALDNLQIILVLSNPSDVPSLITNVLTVDDKKIETFSNGNKPDYDKLFSRKINIDLSKIKRAKEVDPFQKALVFKNVFVKYRNRIILNGTNWEVNRGEKWALLGKNGAGKSTLLSLVSGDNPQAYANDITLFDRKRGTGESIWDIKKRIGYISPEMHLFYLKNVKCVDVVSSGLFDTIGLYRKCTPEQHEIAMLWMEVFGIAHLKDVSFLNVSSGEQRLALLARLFVKDPALLILDEPLHGLDMQNKKLVKAIIEEFCTEDKALIYVTHYEDEIPSVVNNRLTLIKYKN